MKRRRAVAGCLTKPAYPDRAAAESALAAIRERAAPHDKPLLSVYRCYLCEQFHVGRKLNKLRGRGPIPPAPGRGGRVGR